MGDGVLKHHIIITTTILPASTPSFLTDRLSLSTQGVSWKNANKEQGRSLGCIVFPNHLLATPHDILQ
jgi:hypothetical protein